MMENSDAEIVQTVSVEPCTNETRTGMSDFYRDMKESTEGPYLTDVCAVSSDDRRNILTVSVSGNVNCIKNSLSMCDQLERNSDEIITNSADLSGVKWCDKLLSCEFSDDIWKIDNLEEQMEKFITEDVLVSNNVVQFLDLEKQTSGINVTKVMRETEAEPSKYTDNTAKSLTNSHFDESRTVNSGMLTDMLLGTSVTESSERYPDVANGEVVSNHSLRSYGKIATSKESEVLNDCVQTVILGENLLEKTLAKECPTFSFDSECSEVTVKLSGSGSNALGDNSQSVNSSCTSCKDIMQLRNENKSDGGIVLNGSNRSEYKSNSYLVIDPMFANSLDDSIEIENDNEKIMDTDGNGKISSILVDAFPLQLSGFTETSTVNSNNQYSAKLVLNYSSDSVSKSISADGDDSDSDNHKKPCLDENILLLGKNQESVSQVCSERLLAHENMDMDAAIDIDVEIGEEKNIDHNVTAGIGAKEVLQNKANTALSCEIFLKKDINLTAIETLPYLTTNAYTSEMDADINIELAENEDRLKESATNDENETDEKLKNMKKEKSTDCDSALIPLLCVHG